VRRKSAGKKRTFDFYLVKENHICFDFRTVGTWFEQFAAYAFSAELLTGIQCRLLVTVITHLVENDQQSNFSFIFLNVLR